MPGVLQIADGTHLILDETELQPGTLNSVGVENANLLKNLLECQKVGQRHYSLLIRFKYEYGICCYFRLSMISNITKWKWPLMFKCSYSPRESRT